MLKMKKAFDVFFVEMIEKDRWKPNIFLYKIIIKYSTYTNNSDMAFDIFEQVRY
jgi:hypothetical protein